MTVEIERRGNARILLLSNGAVNALSVGRGFVAEIDAAVLDAQADEGCHAIVIAGKGRMFCGGADIGDFSGGSEKVDALRRLLLRIEGSQKLVIMAIHGMALGGGLELAMAGHYRVASRDAQLGLPEVTLGLLPGAGGTQRLPRLIGAGNALDMMLAGKPITADQALAWGLIDDIAEDDLIAGALAMAEMPWLLPRPTGALSPPTDIDTAVQAHSQFVRNDALNRAPACIVDCVSTISTDLAAGLQAEAGAFAELLSQEASKGLRHAFFGERMVSRLPGIQSGIVARHIGKAGVVGGGLMGTGIAISLLSAGIAVTLVERDPNALDRAAATVRSTIERDVEKGRLSASAAQRALAIFSASSSLEELADVDVAIEAVYEDMAVKKDVFGALERIVRDDAILASNTSTLDLDRIASFVADPSRVVGLHFFSPANVMRLLEVVRGAQTPPDILIAAVDLAKRLRKVAVVSGVCDGFIGNRIFEEYLRQVWFMLEEGASPAQIDGAMENWGMAMGPCRTMDLVGQDIGWAIRKRRAVEQPDRPYSRVIDRICELGRFGQKTGKGIYAYPDGRKAVPDPEIERMISEYSAEIGLPRRSIGDAEIVERCLLAMINEGARIVGEGIAYRPVDVDMTLIHGYGFPRERGGPMLQGDMIGTSKLLGRLNIYAHGRNGWAWKPAPLIERLAADGDHFGMLNE